MSVLLDEETVVTVDMDQAPKCETQRIECPIPAVARMIILCECRKMRLGCAEHIAVTMEWFDTGRPVCKTCGMVSPDYRVVPL